MAKESIDQLARSLAEAVPEGLKNVREDLEKNFRSVLQSGLDKLDLVTREEFEVQRAVLVKTRAKLETLESRLASMEATPGPARKKAKKKAKRKAARKKATRKS
ncbi:MAG: accessory factor UbiK family protein [Gammaproteobacteria bacterium]|nr:accessory factor UbiK family protein [Gammaproteobacteria bacterium]